MLPVNFNLLLGVSLIHLVLIFWGAGYFWNLPETGAFGRLTRSIADFSGANSRFGFFAPTVGPQARVRILTDKGKEVPIHLKTSEGMQRIHNLASLFLSPQLKTEELRSMAASWAAFGFSKELTSVQLTVVVEIYQASSLVDAQKGSLPKWQKYYESTFKKNDS